METTDARPPPAGHSTIPPRQLMRRIYRLTYSASTFAAPGASFTGCRFSAYCQEKYAPPYPTNTHTGSPRPPGAWIRSAVLLSRSSV
ncbi:hypothetical protein [Microtetraspora sp. NBRC 16547]|uniref:hypothetical protein n=1 Tax=Microtetraspora sp. NBRC 16547 TaxID=3030993 RepID=UPI0024A0B36C|nr:hypothetical protein [Microtetraspora sp. NBRC 16547]GLW97020.1 hypothetical protein Misp02_11070 [Microtetraspora sp. NBRC 16547]